MRFILSTEDINSRGMVVKTSGINIEKFKENPLCLYNHNIDEPIGLWKDVKVENEILSGEPDFDMDDQLACKIKRKVEKGIVKGASIGIQVLDAMEGNDGIIYITESELKEVSITPLPANEKAVRLFKDNKEINFKNMEELKLNLGISKEENTVEANKEIELKVEEITVEAIKEEIKVEEAKEEVVELKEEIKVEEAKEEVKEVVELKEELIDTEVQLAYKVIDNLKSENINLKAELNTLKANVEVENLIRNRKINLNEKESYIKLYNENQNLFFEITKNLSIRKTQSLTELLKNHEIRKGEDRSNWTLTDWDRKDPNGLKLMYDNEPEKFNELYKKLEEENKNRFKKHKPYNKK